MATLYITEYFNLAPSPVGVFPSPVGDHAQIALEPPLVNQTVTISGSHAESAAFNAATRFVRIHTDSICSLTFGSAPIATTAMRRLPADATEYFGVPAGGGFKVSVISNS